MERERAGDIINRTLVPPTPVGSLSFSLFEILIALTIISIIVSMAIPQYRKYQYKARVGEVKVILSAINQLEDAKSAENGKYITCGWFPGRAGSSKQVWGDGGCFSSLGFSSKGPVWCDYAVLKGDYSSNPAGASPGDGEVDSTTAVDITIIARCDVDGDGKYSYYATHDETTEIFGPFGDDF